MERMFLSRGVAATLLTVIAGSAAAAPVEWKNQSALDRAESLSAAEVIRAAATGQNARRVVLRFAEAPTSAERARLAESGVELLAPLGGGSYFARIDGNANVDALSRRVVQAERIRLEHKAHERFLNDDMTPSWAVVSTARSDNALVSERNPIVGAYVVMHKDVDAASPEMDALIASYGGEIRDNIQSVNGLVVEAPLSEIRRLAGDERVQWVEPPLPRMSTLNASNRARVQADTAQSAPHNLDGTGVTVFVYDGDAARATHNDFSGRMTVIDSSPTANHATHVSGTIGGDGSVNSNHRGMAPGVTLLSAGFEFDGSGIFLYSNPGDTEADYSVALSMGADLSNNSIGSNTAFNGFPCSIEGDYGVMAATIDNMVLGSLGEPITIFWAAGNERTGACGNSFGTSPPPGNNKNAITVGALNSNNDSMTTFSSWGPSDDGRVRPVISAPGCQSNSDGGVTSTSSSSDTAYSVACGTSMASPTAAGVGALILQDFRNMYPSWGDPSNQLMKTILIMGAADILNPGPDYQSGYGSIRAMDSIDFARSGNFDERSVDNAGITTYTANVAPGSSELNITIAWDDPAATPNVATALINDLDLVVIDPDGVRHYPWTLNPAAPNANAVQSQEDHLNNIEQVFVSNPIPGDWQVQVRGTSVPQGPQSFAIGSTAPLGDGFLAMSVLTDVPDLIAPSTPLDVQAVTFPGVDSLVDDSVTIHYRTQGGSFTSAMMNDIGGGSFEATVPGASCDGLIEFYISAEGDLAGTISVPAGGAGSPFQVEIGELNMVFQDNFQTDTGWTVSGDAPDAASGRWERAVPGGDGSRGAPANDFDGSGQCYVTGNGPDDSNTDVDGGTTILTSPTLDTTSDGDAFITYARWYSNTTGAAPNADVFTVEISNNNGGSWTTVEVVGPSGAGTSGGWIPQTIRVADYVAPTDQVRLRFTAEDAADGSVIEAGLDALDITLAECVDAGGCSAADLAEPFGALNFFDVAEFIGLFNAGDPGADLAAPFGSLNFFDVSAYISLYNAGCP
ncbi:MAG: S8 family serine peptidase [Planctomycetota bacterium]